MALTIRLVLPAVLAVCGVLQAMAQTPERLVRPGATQAAPLGKKEQAEAALTESIFSTYVTVGSAAANPATNKQLIAATVKEKLCKEASGTFADEVIKLEIANSEPGSEVQARLKTYDARTVTLMSIVVVSVLEGVSRQAIVDDEAIGPGVYHRAIEGLNFMQGACGFQGDELALANPFPPAPH